MTRCRAQVRIKRRAQVRAVSTMTPYEYQPSRGAEHPKRFLDGFAGCLQSDGYSAYQSLCTNNAALTAVGCMAHVRRKFDEAEKAHPNRKAKNGSTATRALGLIGKLYAVERRIRDLPPQRFVIEFGRLSPTHCSRSSTVGCRAPPRVWCRRACSVRR